MSLETKDQYIVQDNGVTFLFLKNGLLHREMGPAILWQTNGKYINLGDEHLYTVEKIELTPEQKRKWKDSDVTKYNENVFYMLDGRTFSKEDFDLEVKKIQTQRMKDELNEELFLNQSQIKKNKI